MSLYYVGVRSRVTIRRPVTYEFEGNAASLDTTDRDIKEAAGALY
jgi:hypothetical protein